MSSLEDTTNNSIIDINDFIYLEMAHALPRFNRNEFVTRDFIPQIRQQYNNTGLYRSAFFYDNLILENSSLFGNLFFDFDSEDDVELAREDLLFTIWRMTLPSGFSLPMEAFRIWFSGKKGFHLIIPWQYLGVRPHEKLDKIYRWIAEDLRADSPNNTLDLVVYEKRRLFRLENSIHQDTNLYKIPLQFEEVSNWDSDSIMNLAQKNRSIRYPEPKLITQSSKKYESYVSEFNDFVKNKKLNFENRGNQGIKPIGETPQYVKDLIEQGPKKGLRNETAAALTSFWLRKGLDEEEVWENLLSWNNESLPERELRTTMKSIYKRGLTYSLSRLKALSEGEISTDLYLRDKYQKEDDKK